MGEVALYFQYLKLNNKAGLQYKGWPLQLVNVFFTVITDPLDLLLLFLRFGPIGAWPFERSMLVYGLAITSFGLAELLSRGFDVFPWQIKTGAFDRVLLRPRSTIVQVLGMRFNLHRLSRVCGGAIIITWSLVRQGIAISFIDVVQLICAVAGGYLAYSGVFIASSAIAFWTIQALDWIYVFTNGSYQSTKIPPNYLPRWVQSLFTFVMPMLVFSYYPAAAVGKWGTSQFLGWLALPAGAIFLVFSLMLWRVGLRHYSSTGS